MPKNKGLYRWFRTKEQFNAYISEVQHCSRVTMADFFTLALGRMGFREKRFQKLDETISQVFDDYEKIFKDDIDADPKELVYTQDVMDRELKQYTGKLFRPHEERFRW